MHKLISKLIVYKNIDEPIFLELSRIFDRFYRGSNARTDNTSGSGLGLSIAKWIVEEHGGEIEALSSADIGTRMTVIIGEKKHS